MTECVRTEADYPSAFLIYGFTKTTTLGYSKSSFSMGGACSWSNALCFLDGLFPPRSHGVIQRKLPELGAERMVLTRAPACPYWPAGWLAGCARTAGWKEELFATRHPTRAGMHWDDNLPQ